MVMLQSKVAGVYGTHREDLASVVARVEGLIHQVPRHDCGIIAVSDACDAVVALHDALHISLESIPAHHHRCVTGPSCDLPPEL